jgi:hypothetical protein
MLKLFGKIVIGKNDDKGEWPGIVYIYGVDVDPYKYKRAAAILGRRTLKRDGIIGLPGLDKASDYKIVKPTETQCLLLR